jgi:tRNA(Ile)-lysidine synthase
MLEQFLHHIEANKLCTSADKILLAVSGGVDSMVMLHLFRQAGFNVGVAHCNFQLRGEESRGDEALVNTTCIESGIPFHLKRFDTKAYAENHGISTQMAARDLRYQFFNDLLDEKEYRYIATAHHLSDSLETILLNLVRGTGIDGLTGIPVKQINIIRPLLFATRGMIIEYASFHRLNWREDSSNASDKYHRNLLRNQVIPLLKKINPSLEHNFQNTLERLKGSSVIMRTMLDQVINTAVLIKDDQLHIDKQKLSEQPSATVVLWELIKDKGFNFVQCKDIMSNDHQTGKVFCSQTHQLTVDRNDFIISRLANKPDGDVIIEQDVNLVERGRQKLVLEVANGSTYSIDKSAAVAQLDWDKIRFPLTWRNWQPGDRFIPLGMRNPKKLSDFLIDIKVALPDKERVTVLESGGEIVWVVGYRVSERFKISDQTDNVFCVSLHNSI